MRLIGDKLKASLLQDAFQGKLTKQSPEDGDARDFLKEIQAEKERLVKEKKIKEEKPLPVIKDEEIPFDIPKNWVWTRLGEISLIGSGITPDAEYLCTRDGIPYFKVSDMNSLGNETVMKVASCYVTKSDLWKTVPKNSVIYPKNGGALLTNKRRITIDPCIIDLNTGYATPVLCHINYFYYWFLNIDFSKKYTGSAVPTIAASIIKKLLFPLPPLAEQCRIVDKLKTAIEKTDELKFFETKLSELEKSFPNKLKASLLQDAFQGKLTKQLPEDGDARDLLKEIQAEKERLVKEKKIKKEKPLPVIKDEEIPFNIPKNWVWTRLGNIAITNIGLTYDNKNITNIGTIVLRSGNIQNNKIDLTEVVKVNFNIPETKKCHRGDLLICARNGSKELVGKAALIEDDGMSFGAFMALIRSRCNPFIHYFLQSGYYRAGLDGIATTTINQITQRNLKLQLIPLPPVAEQRRIVDKLKTVLEKIDSLNDR